MTAADGLAGIELASVEAARLALAGAGYLADTEVATTTFLASRLGKPILAEGPAGVGKTELAKALARACDARLIRLQCYEGLDEARTLYEWKYPKQLLYTQLIRDHVAELVAGAPDLAAAVERIAGADDAFFSERFLQPRPLLEAIRADEPVVLLIDEVDRADDELEAFFLELLAEMQVTVPELGTLRARRRPLVVLTSNATRELSDALRRRCLYLPMSYPAPAREAAILRLHAPELDDALAARLAGVVARVRTLGLKKPPSVAEAVDWARALLVLAAEDLAPELVATTLTALLKYAGDVERVRAELPALLREN